MTDRIFVDSNVWVYLFTDDKNIKNRAASEYIKKNAETNRLIISYQVLNEVCCVLKKKKYTEPEIRIVAGDMIGLCEVCGYSEEIIYLASELRDMYSLSYWDSHIAASGLASQCSVLTSEDMQDGLIINKMVIKNLFL